jgi:hypothetical protein
LARGEDIVESLTGRLQILFSCMKIADTVVAELRKSMKSAIPQVIGFLSVNIDGLRKTGMELLLNLSQEGSTSCFLA